MTPKIDEAQAIVNAVYRCITDDGEGNWWMDNLKAVAAVRLRLSAHARLVDSARAVFVMGDDLYNRLDALRAALPKEGK